jgi:hypothetical protein
MSGLFMSAQARAAATIADHLTRFWIGTDTTLGVPHAVETRFCLKGVQRDNLRDHSADDSRDPAFAIEYGGSRTRRGRSPTGHRRHTFEESGARELAVVTYCTNRPPAERVAGVNSEFTRRSSGTSGDIRIATLRASRQGLQLQNANCFRTVTRQTLMRAKSPDHPQCPEYWHVPF